jgi:hypothetical protein
LRRPDNPPVVRRLAGISLFFQRYAEMVTFRKHKILCCLFRLG